MASYMQNWWRKHDMDKDGKGCFFIALVIIAGVGAVGICLGILATIVVIALI